MATTTEANVNGEVVPVAEKLEKLSVSEVEASSPSTSEPSTPGTPASSVNSQPQYNFVPFEPHPGYPKSRISIINRFIDEPRELRVAVIGGGLSGILAGVLLPAKVPNIKLTIYEKNHDFGGTWLENVYPGVRCDIPSHVYQSTFEPKLDWSDQFAGGAEIRDYWQGVAKKYNVYQYARFHTKVEGLNWNDTESVWEVTIKNLQTGETTVEKADSVITAIGRFNAWKLPDYPGIKDYKGVLRHASHWDSSFDPTGKSVAVIGNGASGIQLVANLQPSVAQLDHYARNPTWIAASWAGDVRQAGPQPYSEEQIALFKSDPDAYLKFRKEMEDKYWRRFNAFFRGSKESTDLRERFTQIMHERLAKKPELIPHIIPDFSPNCRRLTPGPGYLEALSSSNVSYIRIPILRFTPSGIQTEDGVERPVDAIFCATGANVSQVLPFPVINGQGQNLQDLWNPALTSQTPEHHGYPYTYLGIATPSFPNLFFLQGPHGTGPSGTVPHSAETQITYLAKILRKVSREGIRTITPLKQAADDFVEYCDAFFASTVLTDNCSSWYNGGRAGKRIHGVWPGSAGHLTVVRREVRWEDWGYEYLGDGQEGGEGGGKGNRFQWYFGNGWTAREKDEESDMTGYLHVRRPGERVELRGVHESRWWDLP